MFLRCKSHESATTKWPIVGVTTESEDNMPTITLPDGSQKQFDHAVSIHQVAESIGPGLAKAAIAGKIGGELLDTSHVIEADSEVSIVTSRDDDGLEVLRHSCDH